MPKRPIVAIIGRPNVGKSTLFNRLLHRRQAIVSPIAGTTRDRLYAAAQVGELNIDIIDTAGLDRELGEEVFGPEMLAQVQLAVKEADLLIFMLDSHTGLTRDDQVLADIIRTASSETITFVNKVDRPDEVVDKGLLSLGLGETVTGSLTQRQGTNELIELLVKKLQPFVDAQVAQPIGEFLPRVALIGRPNVGKSTLFNALVEDERVIVSEVPGTTRDMVDSKVEVKIGQSFIVTDTAGLRRRGKIGKSDKVEQYSVMRTMRAIDTADLVLVVADAQEGLTRGDVHAAMYALEQKKQLITVLNKSDLVNPQQVNIHRFVFLNRLPMLFVSAKNKVAIDQLHVLIQERLSMTGDAQSQSF